MRLVTLDIILIFVFLIITLHASFRGFIAEAGGAAWIVLGLLFAFSYYKEAAVYIRTKIINEVPAVPEVLAFLSLLLIVFIVIKILCGMLATIVDGLGLGFLDKLLGLIFGVVKGIIIISFIIFLIKVQPVTDGGDILENSFIVNILMPHIEKVEENIQHKNIIIEDLNV
jgi:membrane protein required for colicin V production